MAYLLDVRRLDPSLDLVHSESSSSLISNDPVCYRNPAFQNDIPEQLCKDLPSTVKIHIDSDIENNNNNNNFQPSKLSCLSPTDSGIVIYPNVPDDSFVDRKSLDSGVYDSKPPEAPGTWPPSKDETKENKESLLAICVQVFIPFLIAGTGTCGAGIVLDYVENWEVFLSVTELFILVPTLLGMKGNLEMTLASRVSTQANLGRLETYADIWQMSWGNMALIQCQATVMGLLAAAFATAMSFVNEDFNISHALLLVASALFTSAAASLLLGAITLTVVIVSHKCNVNPDNVATPIAASLGDITALGLLAYFSNYIYQLKDDSIPCIVIISVFVALVPFWSYLSYRNPFVKQVLKTGWLPVLMAVIITSAGGYILEYSIKMFKGLAIFQPVINGVAGNLVAVQASRISTYFHRNCKSGSRPPDGSSVCVSPCAAFFGKSTHSRTARILMGMVIPGHLLFGYAITFIKGGDTALTPTFLPIYLISAFLQIALLLYIAQCLVQILWLWKVDPDNSAIPLLTALGDLSGIVCLMAAFYIHSLVAPPP